MTAAAVAPWLNTPGQKTGGHFRVIPVTLHGFPCECQEPSNDEDDWPGCYGDWIRCQARMRAFYAWRRVHDPDVGQGAA